MSREQPEDSGVSVLGSRPAVIWVAAAISVAGLGCGVWQTLTLIWSGVLSQFMPLPTLAGLIAGLVGFWLLRWWGLAVGAAAAIYVVALSMAARAPATVIIMVVYYLPMLIAAIVCRRRFKW